MSAERPTVLLYDWDSTLVDAWGGITAALNAALAGYALPLWTIEETRARARVSLREAFPRLFGADWKRAREVFYATLSEQHIAHVRPMPGAELALQAGAGWPQGVVSNKNPSYLLAEAAHLGWSDYFRTVVGAGDAAADKPDPAPIHLALQRLGYAPGPDIWYIGDTAMDMQAARGGRGQRRAARRCEPRRRRARGGRRPAFSRCPPTRRPTGRARLTFARLREGGALLD